MSKHNARNYQHRKPPKRSDRVIVPNDNPANTGRPCPYCGCKFSAAGAVTVTTLSNFAHFTCHKCGRVFTGRSAR